MSSACNNGRPRRLGRAGVTSLEFALVFALFIFMVISVTDLARWMIVNQSLAALMTEYARACLVVQGFEGGGSCNDGGLGTLAAAAAPLLDVTQLTVSVMPYWPPANPAFLGTSVSISYPFAAVTPWLSGLNGTVTSNAVFMF